MLLQLQGRPMAPLHPRTQISSRESYRNCKKCPTSLLLVGKSSKSQVDSKALCVCSLSVTDEASLVFSPFISRQCTPIARGRTHQVEEFLQRKREAMLNKVRAEGQLVCNVPASRINFVS